MKILFLIAAIYLASAAAQSDQFEVAACERSYANLHCRDGFVIDVVRALYGRQNRQTCHHRNIHTTDCTARRALNQVKKSCDGKAFCRVHADNSVFGDPCRGTHKYLEVAFVCRSSEVIYAISQICEGNAGHIACPHGKTLQIVDAFYGRDDRHTCPHRNIRTTSCRAPGSFQKIHDLCQGNRVCRIPANNRKFGDPCRGTYKFVKVFFNCH